MVKAILVPTVRFDYFQKFLTSLKYLPDDWQVYCQIALFTREQANEMAHNPQSDRIAGILWKNERMPPWIARTNILRKFQADLWCNADDDMEFTGYTYVEAIEKKLEEPSCGMISGNWARSESLMHKKIEKLSHKFLKQPAIFTGGGMFFRHDHAQILLAEEIKPWFADDFHMSLTTYLHGYTNYRYLGSLALHRIQTKGGLLTIFQTDNTLVHPDPRYVTLRPCAPLYRNAPNNNYFYPMSSDLTALAHEVHEHARQEKDF